MTTPLSLDTQRRLDTLFDGATRQKAADLLISRCGRNLPFMEDSDERGLERVRFAVLKLSGGEFRKLEEAVRVAETDWRDVVVAAGFGEDSQAHEAWFP